VGIMIVQVPGDEGTKDRGPRTESPK